MRGEWWKGEGVWVLGKLLNFVACNKSYLFKQSLLIIPVTKDISLIKNKKRKIVVTGDCTGVVSINTSSIHLLLLLRSLPSFPSHHSSTMIHPSYPSSSCFFDMIPVSGFWSFSTTFYMVQGYLE